MSQAPTRRRSVAAPTVSKQGHVVATSRVERRRGSESAEVLVDDLEDTPLSSHDGIPDHRLARVDVGVGSTINMGNFESVRVDIRVSLPCDVADVGETYSVASEHAMDYFERERARWVA